MSSGRDGISRGIQFASTKTRGPRTTGRGPRPDMSDPAYAVVLLLCFLAALAMVRFFKTLDPEFWSAAATPLLAGVVSGFLLRLLPVAHPIATGVVFTIASLYARLTSDETEPIDGMLR